VLQRQGLRRYTFGQGKITIPGRLGKLRVESRTGRKGGAKMAGNIVSRSGLARWGVGTGVSRRAGLSASASRLPLVALLGAGASSLALSATAANFNVNNASDLANAINNAANGDTITLTSDITLGSNLPAVTKNVTIEGNGMTLSGANLYRGFIVGDPHNASVTPTVAINDLSIVDALAKGGDGGTAGQYKVSFSPFFQRGGGGGGGAGLGGALLVLAEANVTVTNVAFESNNAQGGNGGGRSRNFSYGGGGGGGYLDSGGNAAYFCCNGGNGGAGGGGEGGAGVGIIYGGTPPQAGGFGGGGGGAGFDLGRGARGQQLGIGGNGGFGGGGGGNALEIGGTMSPRTPRTKARGGFGGGYGATEYGGGGAGLGGAVFVQQGGALALAGSLIVSGNTVIGGSRGGNAQRGNGYGSGFFLQGNGSLTFSLGAGQTQTISDAIADQTGVVGSGGSWSLTKNGAGTTILTGANSYSGGTTINAGALQGNAASIPGDIVDNASLILDQASDGTHTGGISGSGSLTKAGPGALLQNGAVTYSGITTVNGGVLLLNSPLSASSGIVLNGGALGAISQHTTSLTQDITIASTGSGLYSGLGVNLLVSGTVSGGQLTKSGAGAVTLTGSNSFSGINVTGGLLRFASNENLGALEAPIVLNGGSVGTTSDATVPLVAHSIDLQGSGGIDVASNFLVWTGNISGSGQFVKNGAGLLDLRGVDTYSGGTSILGGTLAITSDSALGAAGTPIILNSGTLRASQSFTSSRPITLGASGGSFNVNSGQTLTLTGAVTGGALTKVGVGTLALGSTSNSYSNTFINGGYLLGNSLSIRGNITFGGDPNDGPTAIFNQSINGKSRGGDFPVFSGNIAGDGSLVLSSGNLTLSGTSSYTGGTTLESGTLTGNSNSLQIVNNGVINFIQDFDGTYTGDLFGSGNLVKNGAGKLSTTGNIEVGQFTDVVGGELVVNGALRSPSVLVSSGAALGGNGTIIGVVNSEGGEIEPGNSIGTLHIFGPLEMEPHSEYQVQINGASSDQIQVSEKATIESSTFEIERYNTGASPVVPGKTYTILTTNGGLTVEEPTVAIADFPFINFTLSEDGFNGYLTTSRSAERFAELASTPNEAAVANALDSATSSLAWQQVVGASTPEARAAFSSLSNASIHASAAGVLTEQSHFLRDAVLDRLRQDFPSGATPAPADSVLSYTEDAPSPAFAALPTKKAPAFAPPGPVYAVWAQGLGGWSSLAGNSNVGRTDDSIGGVISGIDVTLDRMWRLGFAGGYTHSNFNSANAAASGSADSYHMALYGGWQGGAWALRGGGSFTWNDIDTSRQVAVVGLGGGQNGSYADKTWQAFGEAAHNFTFGAASLEPFANLAYVHIEGGVSESGLAAMSGSTTFDTTYATLGAHGSYALPGKLTAWGTLGWQHAFGDLTPVTTLAFQSGAAFGLAGSPIARDAFVTELGVDYAIGPIATLGLAYSGQYAGNASENSAKVNFTLRF
jgi:outer membrane autotransporter protein